MSDGSVEMKRREAERARERLLGTAHELQARVKPAALAEQAVDKLRRRSEQATDDALAAARRRPAAVAAAAAGVTALILARPIGRLVRRVRNKGKGAAARPERRREDGEE